MVVGWITFVGVLAPFRAFGHEQNGGPCEFFVVEVSP